MLPFLNLEGFMASQMANQAVEVAIPSRRLGRSVWAIVAGFLAVVILSIATDVVLHKAGIYPPIGQRLSDKLSLLSTIYRTFYAILGSYITARLAPSRPMFHAFVGAAIGMILGTLGAVATWNKDLGPHWYSLVLVLEGIPCAWVGARIRLMQLSHPTK
jgi:hypothetical protein